MKKLIFITIILSHCFGQAQAPESIAALEKFQTHYNTGDAEAVFNLFSPSMQQSVNLQTTTQIVNSFQQRFGDLKTFSFEAEEGISETYNVHFERGKQSMRISLDRNGKFSGLLFKPFEDNSKAKMERNLTELALPFKGDWFTVWGGDTKAQNYHVIDRAQRHAFDFLILGKNNKTYERSGTRNEDYYAFGKPLYAVCDAEVVSVTTGVADNKPGAMNPTQPLGNSVILKTDKDEYIVYAHFEEGTLKVKEGDRVRKGQFLRNCGHSGNSSEAHLHLHIQVGPNLYSALGVKCYFEELLVNGEPKSDYSPIKLDRIAPPKE